SHYLALESEVYKHRGRLNTQRVFQSLRGSAFRDRGNLMNSVTAITTNRASDAYNISEGNRSKTTLCVLLLFLLQEHRQVIVHELLERPRLLLRHLVKRIRHEIAKPFPDELIQFRHGFGHLLRHPVRNQVLPELLRL